MKRNYFGYRQGNENLQIVRNVFSDKLFWISAFAVFFIPLLIGHFRELPVQIFVGSAVNFFLAVSALRFGWKKSLPVILLPSIAAFASGIVFGSATFFLLYLIPFIWLGNGIYVAVVKKWNKAIGIGAASVAKSTFLFSAGFALFSFGIIPEVFLTAMGIFQLVTAVIGGFLAFLVLKRVNINNK